MVEEVIFWSFSPSKDIISPILHEIDLHSPTWNEKRNIKKAPSKTFGKQNTPTEINQS